jgi:hypothetical protein
MPPITPPVAAPIAPPFMVLEDLHDIIVKVIRTITRVFK